MNKYKLIAFVGEAGSGKDSLMQSLLSAAPEQYHEIVSCTTRPPREGEIEGKNYFFLTNEEFAAKVQAGDMLEYTEFNGWHYGTMKYGLSAEKVNVGVFNPAGIYSLIENQDIDLYIFRIYADDKERLLRQLNREEHPNVSEIVRRYQADEKDFSDFLNRTFKKAKWYAFENNTLKDKEEIVQTILKFGPQCS